MVTKQTPPIGPPLMTSNMTQNIYSVVYVNDVDLECACTLDGDTLALDVYDSPDLVVYSDSQKTVLSSYKLFQHDPCKFRFQVATFGNFPATFGALMFNIGEHTMNPNKTARSFKLNGDSLSERGQTKKQEKAVDLPYSWTSANGDTDIHINRVGDIIQFRSTKCPYALDVTVTWTVVKATVYVDIINGMNVMGMCGNCNHHSNGYKLMNGTRISGTKEERYQAITESYVEKGVKQG